MKSNSLPQGGSVVKQTATPRQTLHQELKAACAQGRSDHRRTGQFVTVVISDAWGVRVETVRNTPRGGPMKAWKYLYYLIPPESLIPPTNKHRLGGYDRADSFCDWALQHIRSAKAVQP